MKTERWSPHAVALTRTLLLGSSLALAGTVAEAQNNCGTTSFGDYYWSAVGRITKLNNCQPPNGFRCYPVENPGFSVQKVNSACNPSAGSCLVRAHATATLPGLRDMVLEDNPALTPLAEWYPCSGAGCAKDLVCGIQPAGGVINFDTLDTYVQKGLSCSQAWTTNLSVKIRVCAGSSCESPVNNLVIEIPSASLASGIGCPIPLPTSCAEGNGGSSGAAGLSCPLCQPVGAAGGPGCSVPVGGGGPSCVPASMGKAQLRYAAGGAGGDGLPGAAAWRTVLGRFWSHDYAERIVVDPDSSHVWLLTRSGSFREFSNLAGGTGLRLYQGHAPSDELRTLSVDTASGGWQLQTLDGRKDFFLADGRWDKTLFSADPTHAIQGTYNAGNQLVSVSFPDGRSDSFTYQGGKLASISEVAVAGSGASPRTWGFTWIGDELTLATRPDGSSWRFFYEPARPGYLTRVDLVNGAESRVMAAFTYETGSNNVAQSWSGDPDFAGPTAVDKASYTYTPGASAAPVQTQVSEIVSASFTRTRTFVLARDTVSIKPKVVSIQGTCPTCGLSPTTSFAYTGANPLLPSSMTDAKGTRTDSTYDANGRVLTRTEAANVAGLTRTTTYTYDANFPGLATRIEVPSTSGGTNKRRTDSVYHPATGLMSTRLVDGFEAGAALPAGFKTTSYAYNASGEILTIDPPGSSTADVTSFTYNLAGRNGHIRDTRTVPLVGTATFGYDGLNRQTSVIDPNNVETQTSYDSLGHVTEIRQKGATPAEDLVTTYIYNLFGDLFCVKLPRGNGTESLYDTAGRLLEIRRGTAVAVPTNTSCLDTAQPRERTIYQLDGLGHRSEESFERWSGTAWVSDAKTAFTYTCHLDRVTQGAGSATPSVTENCYDLNDNLEKTWDPNHPKATNPNPTQLYAYDALNRLTALTTGPGTANAATTSYAYDIQDHLAQVTDAESNITTYTTSDRDLQTRQVSPVSGTTTYAYNEHGQLTTQLDARTVTTARTLDVLDRVTLVHTSDGLTPDVTYTYDAPCAFGKGRLCAINNGTAVGYVYDRFGRALQDGALTYQYDTNGNRTAITYPGSVTANYTYDFADRQSTLSYNTGAGSQSVVTSAAYLASGPLTQLVLANGLTEQHLFDARTFPSAVSVTSPTALNWAYTLDNAGNITQINDGTTLRTYSYVDNLYFLKQGDGPWGLRSWTYDRIGNRLSETRGTTTDTYSYTNHNPRLTSITLGGGAGTKDFIYDSAGNEIRLATPLLLLYQRYDGANRLFHLKDDATGATTYLTYDGRNYLTQARQDITTCCAPVVTQSVYSSEGILHGRTVKNIFGGTISKDTKVLYFAGRPVGLLEVTTAPAVFSHLSVDHLGTPILETNSSGTTLWSGGLEPFGKDWNGAQAAGQFLRFPGQWEDAAWGFGEAFFNVNRYYARGTGRYTSPDPLGLSALNPIGPRHLYAYGESQPTNNIDQLGLYSMDPSCNKWCGPPSIGQCSTSPAGQCVFPMIEDITHRVFRNQACRRALEAAGVWRDTAGALMPTSEYPVISCREGDCVGPGSSIGRYFAFSHSIPICSNYFVLRWELGAQTLFHEILHSAGLGHNETERTILKTCYPGFEP